MSSIGFAHELVAMILDSTKTLTYRLGYKYDFLSVGDIIDAKDSSNNMVFGKIRIIEKYRMSFIELPIDTLGHESYVSKSDQKQVFQEYYNRCVSDEDIFIILKFELIKN